VIEQVLGVLWLAMPRDIVGRGHHCVALRRAERDRDHILRQVLAVTNAGVEPLRDDIDERSLGDNLQLDLRIGFDERRDHRRQHQIDCRRRRVDPQPTRRHRAQASHLLDCATDFLDGRADAGEQQLARLRQRNAAGGAIHQANAQPFFHGTQTLAQARHRDALVQRRPAEIPGACDGEENAEVAQVEVVHCSIY